METEFWGVEVKSGEPLNVLPGYGKVLHLSQASLGEHKHEKGKESVSLFVNVDEKKLVLGTLITNKLPQHQFDLLFDRKFELSHDWKCGSVYFYGYKASNSIGDDESPEGESDESESDEDFLPNLSNNGKRKPKAEQVKPELTVEANAVLEKPEAKVKQENPEFKDEQQKPERKAKQEMPESKVKQVKTAEGERSNAPNKESAGRDLVKDVNPQEDGESNLVDLMSEDDEEKLQVETSKKRPVQSAIDTPVPDKKAKVILQETDKAVVTPINQANRQASKPGKAHHCKICHKAFGTEQGMEAHTKAKHGDGK